LVSSLLVIAALQTAAAAAGPAAGPEPLAALRASLDRSLTSLPAEVLATPRALRRHGGAGQARAEALFAGSLAAAWVADTGVVLALPHDVPSMPPTSLLAASVQDAEALGEVTLAGFLAAVWRELPTSSPATPRVIVKLPRVAFRADGGGLAAASAAETAAHAAVVLQEGFETDPFSVWLRQDNTGGQYTWGQTTCDRHQGSYAADPARGGTVGAAAACSAAYPSNYEAWLWDPRCNSVRGAAQAWLDFYLGFSVQTGDSVAVCFPGSDNRYYCHGYAGTISGWWHVTDNLQQWFMLGDMTAFDCIEVNFLFDSDATPATTFGARIDDVTVRTDAPPTVSCGITATPATGPAPLAVSFAGVATGTSGAATYRWWFDDAGAQATTQNAAHTFSSPGDYDVSLVVSDGSERCNAWTRVTVTQQACAVDCSASVPATAQAGAAVAFAGSVTPVGCPASTPVWEWTFGDGQTSSEQSPSHTYAAAGTYAWTLRVTVAGTPCTCSGAITVSAPPSAIRQLVPSVAQQPGVGGTQWRTSVAAVNRAAEEAMLDLTFVSDTTTLSRAVTLPAGAAYEWGNVLAELFQVSGAASGALRIDSSVPVLVTSRTYNQTAAGTFGQYYPALGEAHALRAGQTGVLPQLKKTSGFRTNIGAANLGSAAASVLVRLHGAGGQQVGSTRTIAVEAGRWKQESDIFTTSGAGTQEVAYATVAVSGATDLVWVYASVIDAQTGDPTTIPVVVDASLGTVIGAAAAPAMAAATQPIGDGAGAPLAVGAGGGTGLGIAAATPEDGYYSGTTSPQGLPMGLLVESGGIKQLSIKYDCGGWTSDATYSYGAPCAVSGGTFDCGSTSCVPGGSVRITGTFATPTSVSGVIEIKDKPAWPPGATCCQISGLAYSASKGGTPPPTVTASATPTSGQAPLEVAFTGSVTGGTAPLAFNWTFGDGQSSTLQSPSHVYSSQGTYVAWLTVTDAQSRRGSDTVQITVSEGAALQASAAATPASGSVPLTVAFTGSATGGTPPYTWGWTFGDGGTSTLQSPIYTYAAAGTYTALLTVTDAAQRTATATAAITASGAATYRYLIPSVAHNPGAGGTMWRTAVAAVNRSGAMATLQLRYVAGDGLTLLRTVTLAADAAQEWVNILETLLGLAATASSSGTLEVTADRPVFLTSRTYNQTPGGTYGQYFPSLTAAVAMGPGRTGVLPHLKKNAAFRTNVGVLNLGPAACTAEIRLFGASGTQVGSARQLPVPAGRWVQQNDIFAAVGAGSHDVAYATVTVPGSGDLVWAYASVLDGTTGDPTTIPLLLATP
jgi:PKD repeat protein